MWPQASGRKEEKCLGVSFCKKMQAAFVGRLKAGVPHLSSAGFCLQYKLCKVRKIFVGTKGIPHLVTHDARTIRYPDPLIKVNDTIQIDLETGKITDFIKFDTGESRIPCKTLGSWRAKNTVKVKHSCQGSLA